jgi:hypothetical protein
MAINSGTQLIGTTRSQIDGNSVHWVKLTIRNNEDTKTLYVGNNNVSVANGLPIDKLSTQSFDIPPGESLSMISDSGTHSVSWLRIEMH